MNDGPVGRHRAASERAASPHEAQFLAQYDLAVSLIDALARRHRLAADAADDFRAFALEHLVADDYAVFRKFRGDSALSTYLTVVVAMRFRDWRVARWGRWRPSAVALRAGPLAVRLETLVYRDGHTLAEAGELLRTRGETDRSDRELAVLLAALPVRPARREPALDAPAESVPDAASADTGVLDGERAAERARIEAAITDALAELPAEDRAILRLRYWEGRSIADVARALGLEQRPLYRRVERALAALRAGLVRRGLSADTVRSVLAEGEP